MAAEQNKFVLEILQRNKTFVSRTDFSIYWMNAVIVKNVS